MAGGWRAANVAKRRRSDASEEGGSGGESEDGGYDASDEQHKRTAADGTTTNNNNNKAKRKKSRRSAETAEAAIARLSASYNTAMEAVGALHRASAAIARARRSSLGPSGGAGDNNNNDSEEAAMCRVARAARSALAESILMDPLVRPYAPTWAETAQAAGADVNANADDGRTGGASLTSAAHRSTVKELAYLVLVNYADLVTCGCCCTPPVAADTSKSLLDRGTVRVLPALKTGAGAGTATCLNCCWGGESEEDTKRLALVAYCDASELDRSDPTLWLKVACAARSLGRIVFAGKVQRVSSTSSSTSDDNDDESVDDYYLNHNPSPALLDYHRLERYALESGLSCLPSGAPPNRAIVRAYRELQAQSDVTKVPRYLPVRSQQPETPPIVIDLPRYSWSVAGRALMRAFRLGGAFVDHEAAALMSLPASNTSRRRRAANETEYFGSASIDIRISPVLILPLGVLGAVCEYIEREGGGGISRDIMHLECTCRALSADIVNARAVAEKARRKRMTDAEQRILKDSMAENNKRAEGDDSTKGRSGEAVDRGEEKEEDEGTAVEQAKEKTKTKKKKSSARSNRSSKRVLSKRITSGKNAERSAKRKSEEYCLVSAVFSCTTQHPVYSECLKKDPWWNKSHVDDALAPGADTESPAKKAGGPGTIAFPTSVHDSNSSFSDLDSSLRAFALKWSGENSGANDVLFHFLLHVSWYIGDVFSSEAGDTVGLSSCVLECFKLIANRRGNRDSMAPSWIGKEDFTADDSVREVAEVICINLVNAELRLKRCERDNFANNSFEGDAICLAYMVPQLLTLSRTLTEVWSDSSSSSSSYVTSGDVTKIAIRCHWLAASYNLWLGRSASQLQDIRDAETAALENIGAAIACFANFGDESCTVQTPHLHCVGRSGKHWRELSTLTLSSYQNELQASFVVSRSRQQYQELKLDERSLAGGVGEVELTSEEATTIQAVASELLGRYGVDYEGLGGKHDELVSDLLKYHNAEIEALLPSFASESETGQQEGESLPAQKWKQLWNVVALTSLQWKEMALARDVSLLTILSACSQSRVDAFEVHASLLSGLVLATLDQFEQYVMQRRGDKTASTQQHSSNDRGAADSSDGFFSDSDDDQVGGDGINSPSLETVQEDKAIFISRLFTEKLAELITMCPDPDLVKDYASSTTFRQLLYKAIILSSGKHAASSTQNELVESPPKLEALNSISYVVAAIFDKLDSPCHESACRELSADLFKSLVEVIVRMRKSFPVLVRSKSKTGDKQQRMRRSHHQAVCSTYASFIAVVGSDIARLLSLSPSVLYSDGDLQESHLLSAIVSDHHNVLDGASDSFLGISPSPTPPLQPDFSTMVKYIDSLLWFWKYIINADVIGGSRDMPASHPGVVPASIIHRTTARELVVPIASSIISLCGAIGSGERSVAAQLFLSSHNKDSDEFLATMSEYCDTDDSANGWFSDDDGSGSEDGSRQGGPDTLSSRSLLKMILQSVQCCGLIFSGISEKLASSSPKALFLRASVDHGPLLPVVTVRSLTKFADVLLIVFGSNESDRRGAVWAEQYPYSTRSTGHQLDALLHKAYRCLHGFALTSQGNSPNNDLATPVMSISSQFGSSKSYPPESQIAAAQMYRCIRRAYPTKGRRSPPKSALECVAAALPPAEETQKSKAIREFVLSRLSSPTVQSDGGDSVSSKDPESVELLPQFPAWVLTDEKEGTCTQNRSAVDISENMAPAPSNNATPPPEPSLPGPVTADAMEEVRLVRKGICEEMAQGALPRMSGSGGLTSEVVGSKEKGQTKSESVERQSTAQFEREIFEKFTAILDYLCYEPTDADSWYRLGLLLSFKADIICDRLATPRDQDERGQSGICVPNTEPKREELLPLAHLIETQLDEDKTTREGRVALLGTNLSPYIQYPWATLSSLRSCSKSVKAFCYVSTDGISDSVETTSKRRDQAVFNDIEAMFEKGDFIGWERGWGGLFVSATIDMMKKCFITAHYLSLQDKYLSDEKDELCYEVAEQFATSCYAELMGGISYGYPMREMTNVHRRRLARESKSYFEAAIDFAANRKLDENVHDLYFMIGKCEEKIAKTLSGEAFPQPNVETERDVGNESCPTVREYERMLQSALESYATAHREMKKAERGGSLADFQQGGSSHGFAEITYRQHACRLKAHIAAVRYPKESREAAEREALRISRSHWYTSPGEESAAYDPNVDIRNSVWEVLADCVTAMVKLRNDSQFFHRSVYRHAMALLWAPILCDPETGYANGSNGDIPAIKSYHIRGLNTGDGACVKSAMAVISALFDKKRPQLCGVWVATTGNPSSFEVLNDAIRKYDNLRWKYCDAYIDIMGLCRRRDILTTFLGWVDTAQRDLPAFYDAGAALGGTAPDTIHSKENLLHGSGFLWSIKRRANCTIAEILLQELSELDGDNNGAVTKRLDIFKDAYSCFLRLKAPVNDRSWKSQKVEDGVVMEVEAICRAFQDLEGTSNSIERQNLSSADAHPLNHNDKMILLRCAIAKCEELFPGLVPTRKRTKRQPSKTTTTSTTTHADDRSDEKKEGNDDRPSTANNAETGQSPKDQSTSSGKGKKKGSSSTSTKSKDKTPTKKKATNSKSKQTNKSPSAKRDEGDYRTVDVPDHLKEGDVFEVRIDVGGGKHQSFKMKVPAGKHKKLRFKLPSKVKTKKK